MRAAPKPRSSTPILLIALILVPLFIGGAFATLCAVAGSLIRPLGGYLSDRFGGIRVLTWLYLGVAATMAGVSSLPPVGPCTLLLVTGMTLLGMGNGAVFQLVAQRFPEEIGVITSIGAWVQSAPGSWGRRQARAFTIAFIVHDIGMFLTLVLPGHLIPPPPSGQMSISWASPCCCRAAKQCPNS